MKKLFTLLLATGLSFSAFASDDCGGVQDEVCHDVPSSPVSVQGIDDCGGRQGQVCHDVPSNLITPMFTVGVYPVGAPVCVGPGICYQQYCHDTGYCWYEQIR